MKKNGLQLRKLRWICVYTVIVFIVCLIGADDLTTLSKAFPDLMRGITIIIVAGVYFPFCEILNYY